jgi:hypothetical protein
MSARDHALIDIETKGGSGGGGAAAGSPALLGDAATYSHITTITMNLQDCPVFNEIGTILDDSETIVVPDDFGCMARKLQHLTHLGLLEFVSDEIAAADTTKVSWSRMLAIINFEAFKSNEITRKGGLADQFHTDVKMGRSPWAGKPFRDFQCMTCANLAEFSKLIRLAKENATTRRQIEGIPTRQLQQVGDTVYDREGSFGDAGTLILHSIMGEHITTMLGNHELGLIGIFQAYDRELAVEESVLTQDGISPDAARTLNWLIDQRPAPISRLFQQYPPTSRVLREIIQFIHALPAGDNTQLNAVIGANRLATLSESGLQGTLRTLSDAVLQYHCAKNTIPAEGSLPYYPSVLSLWATLLPPEGEAIDKNGNYTEAFKANYQRVRGQYYHWMSQLKYVQRAGLSDRFIMHAPQIGLANRTTEESIVHDVLTPVGYMLRALMFSSHHHSTAGVRAEAKILHDNLNRSVQSVSIDNLDGSLTSQASILCLIEDINQSAVFFIRNNLFVAEETLDIPEGSIGLYSTTDRFEGQNKVWLRQVGSQYADLETVQGASIRVASMMEPAVGGFFGMGLWGDGAAKPELLNRDRLQLKPLDTIFGHTSESGPGTPYPGGIDRALDKRNPETTFPVRVARIDAVIPAQRLREALEPVAWNTEALVAHVIQEIVRLANEAGSLMPAEADDIEMAGGRSNILQAIARFCQGVNDHLEEDFDPDADRIIELRATFLHDLRHACADNELLITKLDILARCLASQSEALTAAEHSHSVSKRTEGVRSGIALLWQALATLSPTAAANALPAELALEFIAKTDFDPGISGRLEGEGFAFELKKLVLTLSLSEAKYTESPTPVFGKVLAGLAIPVVTAKFLALLILLSDLFMSSEFTFGVQMVLGNLWLYSALTALVTAGYVLVDQKDKMPGCVNFLNFLANFFPRLSGIGKQQAFNFVLRLFLYPYFIYVGSKFVDIERCEPAGNISAPTTVAPVTDHLSTPQPQQDSVFGNPTFAPLYPYMIPALAVALVLSACSTYLIRKDPSVSPSAGQPRPIGLHGRLEMADDPVVQKLTPVWHAWLHNVENTIAMIGGIYGMLTFATAACFSHMAATVATTIAAALLILRLASFPSKCCPGSYKTLMQPDIRRRFGIASIVLSTLFSATNNWFLITTYFFFAAMSNFGIESFNTDDPSQQPKLWAAWAATSVFSLGAYFADYIANSKQQYLAADDSHAAEREYRSASLTTSRAGSSRSMLSRDGDSEARGPRGALLGNGNAQDYGLTGR